MGDTCLTMVNGMARDVPCDSLTRAKNAQLCPQKCEASCCSSCKTDCKRKCDKKYSSPLVGLLPKTRIFA